LFLPVFTLFTALYLKPFLASMGELLQNMHRNGPFGDEFQSIFFARNPANIPLMTEQEYIGSGFGLG
jgi:hypothetical protein